MHGSIRKELTIFLGELGGESLIVGNDERRLIVLGNDICHSERLSRTCDSEQGLLSQTLLETFYQTFDRIRLVAGWFVFRCELENAFGHFVSLSSL